MVEVPGLWVIDAAATAGSHARVRFFVVKEVMFVVVGEHFYFALLKLVVDKG